jgi:hypothetical protein
MKIGWIGTGVMGHSMAGHLLMDRTLDQQFEIPSPMIVSVNLYSF